MSNQKNFESLEIQQKFFKQKRTINETVYENFEEGNEWVANDEEDPDNWLEEKIEEGNEENANEVPNIVLW